MNNKLLLIPFFSLLLCCKNGQDADNFLFSVPLETVVRVQVTDRSEPPLPPLLKPFYTNFNFIIDSTGNLYYFQHQTYRYICGTGIDENAPPEYIDLRPIEIVAVPINGLDAFIRLNILNHDPEERVVAIGLSRDTLMSEGLYKLTQVLKDTSNKTRWFIRNITQEESIVLDYKKRQARFYPENIHWDSSKTRFPPVEFTKFTPPDLEE